MDLTQQQISALQHGDIVPLTVDETECVVLRKDVFDQMQKPVYDDGDWTEEETSALAARMFTMMDEPEKIE